MRIKRLYILIIKSYIGPLILTFFISLFLLVMQFLWKYIDELVGKGLDWKVISTLLFYASSSFVPMALPLAILLSSIMTFGNLGEHYELVALKSSGISLQKIMLPLIVLSFAICICALGFSNYVMPVANLKFRALLYDVRHLRPELNIKEGIFYNGIDGYNMKISKKDKKKDMLYGIMIYDHTLRYGNTSVAIADSGHMNMTSDEKYLILDLYSGYRYEEVRQDVKNPQERTLPHRRDKFEKQRVIFELTGYGFTRTDESLFKDHFEMLNLKQLAHTEDSLRKNIVERKKFFYETLFNSNFFRKEIRNPNAPEPVINDSSVINLDTLFAGFKGEEKAKMLDIAADFARSTKMFITASKNEMLAKTDWLRRHQIEWHRKFALSFSCFVLFFIGAPLGAIIRKGGLGMPTVVSVIFFILYYVISITGEKFIREGICAPAVGMWMPSFVLLPIGIFLTYKATTDSGLLNIDAYLAFFRTILKRKKKQ